jgi:putative membrane protein
MLWIAGAGALVVAGNLAIAQQPQTRQKQKGSASRTVLSAPDQRFVEHAAKEGHKEVELGKLAVEKAANPKVKEFGQRQVDDHGKMNKELEALAKEKGVTLPMSHTKDATEMKLSKMSGAAFDKAYMHDMVMDHEKTIAAFETESKSGTDPELKDWAGKQLPALRSQLEAAKSIQP